MAEGSDQSDKIAHEVSETDGNAQESGDGATEETRYGMTKHQFSYKLKVLNLSEHRSRGFQASFNTKCETSPTSWLCEMVFLEVQDDGKVYITFKLKRTDSAGYSVRVRGALDLRDSTNTPLFCYPCFIENGVKSGHIIEKSLTRKLETPEEISYFNAKLYINIDIKIETCHFDLEREYFL